MTGWGRWSTVVQKIEIWPYEQMVYAQTKICAREWDAQTSQVFWDTNRSSNLGQKTRSRDCKKSWKPAK